MKTNNHANPGPDSDSRQLIFVVDDEPMLLKFVTLVLEPLGYALRSFPSPDAALAAFTNTKPSPALIITDYHMPIMTGLDLLRECRLVNPGQKVILISGTVEETVCPDSAFGRPSGFLRKPFQVGHLIALVKQVLASQQTDALIPKDSDVSPGSAAHRMPVSNPRTLTPVTSTETQPAIYGLNSSFARVSGKIGVGSPKS